MKFDIKDAMKKPTIGGQVFWIEELDQLSDELLEEIVEEDHLKTALTKSNEAGYLHNDTLRYEMHLNSQKEVEGSEALEDLIWSETKILAVIEDSSNQARSASSV